MVHIQAKVRTNSRGRKYTRYIVRWTPPGSDIEGSKSFEQRVNPRKPGTAEHFEAQLKESIRNYGYVDPKLGQTLVKEYAETWRDRALNINTRRLRQGFIDDLGELATKTLVQVQASSVREWLDVLVIHGRPWAKGRKLSPSTEAVVAVPANFAEHRSE
ncbi:hypothetical protein AB0C34_01545 [Nocardia sp. NPDC049220]|uniref:hypothetical protein n=1 Tax=Nocardia sp. NPDC049220 TaxID=3155273 RepID=UPI0033C2245B